MLYLYDIGKQQGGLVILGKEMLCFSSIVKPDVFSLTLPRPLAGMGHSWDATVLTGCAGPP